MTFSCPNVTHINKTFDWSRFTVSRFQMVVFSPLEFFKGGDSFSFALWYRLNENSKMCQMHKFVELRNTKDG